MESKTSPKDVEVEHFAHELAGVLHHGHGQQSFANIILIAPPHFLGLLRKLIHHTVSKLIGTTLDKDYMHLSDDKKNSLHVIKMEAVHIRNAEPGRSDNHGTTKGCRVGPSLFLLLRIGGALYGFSLRLGFSQRQISLFLARRLRITGHGFTLFNRDFV